MEDDPAMALNPTSKKPTSLIALRHGGTHLIQPLLRHMTGRSVSTPKGNEALTYVPGPKCVIFTRDPRNRMVSHFRYKYPGRTPSEVDQKLARLMAERKDGLTPLDYMARWAERWAMDWDCYRTNFEQLIADPLSVATLLRGYLDAPGDPLEAVEFTLGKSGTWTGRHSQWQEWFGPESRREWAKQGGDRLVRLMGYD